MVSRHAAGALLAITLAPPAFAHASDAAGGGVDDAVVVEEAGAPGLSSVVVPPLAEEVVRVPEVRVLGQSLADGIGGATPGAGDEVRRENIERARPSTVNEVLRQVPGVLVRDEEGLGLRPNIGLRGLDPTRSGKVLLLEDGIPLGFAPYGDNAAYYHPPLERIDAVEILKGASQLQFGPRTIGGAINYKTPQPSATPGGFLKLTAGNRSWRAAHLSYGGMWGENGLRLDLVDKQGQGARANSFSEATDASAKAVLGLGAKAALTLRASRFHEETLGTYSGLTLAEWKADPYQNPFRHDRFTGIRDGLSATHEWTPDAAWTVTTNLYGTRYERDWWRQSSTSDQRPNDADDAACGSMANLDTSCGNQGRLRRYETRGLEPRAAWRHRLFDTQAQLDAGLRWHEETQNRRQENGASPDARAGEVKENNLRAVSAFSGFVQERFSLGRFTLQPGVRFEHVRLSRTNHLTADGVPVSGRSRLTEVLPGVGANVNLDPRWTLFAGIHRGFAPPRPEDVIANADGKVVELAPELSWNSELGVRARPHPAVRAEVTAFLLAFDNQIVPASVAGGQGAAQTNGGRTRNAGLEAAWHLDTATWRPGAHRFYSDLAYTWLPVAEYVGARQSAFDSSVSVTGNRLPYAARHLATVSAGWSHQSGVGARAELVHVGDMFSDDTNTAAFEGTANGQRGLLPAYDVVNVAADWAVPAWRTTFFATAKNLLDATYLVDRTRGMLPGTPRLIQGGARFTF